MCDEKPLVSVIIPTYSRNDTLIRAISSALKQTYQNIEIIVVDDNPVDSQWRKKTTELMSIYADNKKIRYIQNAVNMGGSGARNEGIKAARGEYIAFLDDDDEYLPENIEMKISAFDYTKGKKLALVYGYCEYVDNCKVVYVEKKNFNGCCMFDAMEQNCIAATSQWIVKKEALLDIGLFPIVPSKQDSQTMLKLLASGYEILCVPEVLSRYYMDISILDHISTNGTKPLMGELLYYNECQKYFNRFNKKQLKRIEFSFSKVFHEKYNALEDSNNCVKYKKQMYRLFWWKSFLYFIRIRLRKIKNNFKS